MADAKYAPRGSRAPWGPFFQEKEWINDQVLMEEKRHEQQI